MFCVYFLDTIMPVFEYKGIDDRGVNVEGVITADTPREARNKLRKMEIHTSEIKTAKRKQKAMSLLKMFKRGKDTEITNITRQLSTLLKSGIPLTDSIQVLIDQIENPSVEKAFRDIREALSHGSSFGAALENHPYYFSPLYISMIKAGEASGTLPLVLERLSDYTYKRHQVENKIRATLAYPVVLLFMSMIIMVVVFVFILPKITKMLEKQGQELPFITLALKSISDFLVSYGIFAAAGAIGLLYLFSFLLNTEKGKAIKDKMMLNLPLIGDLFKKSVVSRFAITFATLLKTGIPAIEGLKIVETVVDNVVVSNTLIEVRNRIVEGADISTPLKASGIFPPVVGYMISVGERSGNLEELLDRIAEAYDMEIEIASQKLVSALEPIMILAMAGVVAIIILGVLLPILNLSASIQ